MLVIAGGISLGFSVITFVVGFLAYWSSSADTTGLDREIEQEGREWFLVAGIGGGMFWLMVAFALFGLAHELTRLRRTVAGDE